jgi:hypothetical protein
MSAHDFLEGYTQLHRIRSWTCDGDNWSMLAEGVIDYLVEVDALICSWR